MKQSILTKNQKIKTSWKIIRNPDLGQVLRIRAEIRYDDDCGNGHNTFSITGTIEEKKKNNHWYDYAGGCLHEEIAEHFPEYAHLIKWHLVSSDGPMHGIANTLYHAGDKDCWGKRKGEPLRFEKHIKFENFPITFKLRNSFIEYLEGLGKDDIQNLKIEAIDHGKDASSYKFSPKYTFVGFADKWHNCPFDTLQEIEEFREALQTHNFSVIETPTSFSDGKERDLDAARSCAVWPDATDQELMADDLKERLEARLPALLERFCADMEALGFTF